MRWIGIRAERVGKAAKILKSAGFRRERHAGLNNRMACDFIMPCSKKTLADFKELFSRCSAAGFKGIAFQWTDPQWKYCKSMTDKQWRERIMIDPS